VPFDVDGIASGDTTEGHRFMAPGRFAVTSFEDYDASCAREGDPVAEARADAIWHDATNMAFAAGLEVVEDKGLLAEVAGLVEWPVVLMGEIGADFLDLPPEVLQTSMKEHQKFFSVRNPKTGRIERSSPSPTGRPRMTARRSSRATRRFCRRACRMRSSSGRTTCAWRRRAWATGRRR
jgi:glycyl-tRNA synthetase beta chain